MLAGPRTSFSYQFAGNLITGNASDDDDDNNSDINVALSRSLSQVQKITK